MARSHVFPSRTGPSSVFPAPEFLADPELAAALEPLSTSLVPNEENVLFRQGEAPSALYFVKKGEVALALEARGRIVTCFQAGPGSLVGLPAVVGGEPYTMTAAPSRGADIRRVSKRDVEQLLAKNPALSMKVLQVLAAEIRLARSAMMDLVS